MKPGDYFFVTSKRGRKRIAVIVSANSEYEVCIAVFNAQDIDLIKENAISPDFVTLTDTAFFAPTRSTKYARWVIVGKVDIDCKQYYPIYSVKNGGSYVLSTVPWENSNSVPESIASRFYARFSLSPAAVELMVDQLEDGDLHPKLAGAVYSPDRMGYKALALFEQYS
ncbi:MAG: hypothetical protein Q4P72_06415 [Eubacteriales bacterium]|nr:hypothetical protein [Eubacteriales bacterium]